VYGNAATLACLTERVAAAISNRPWRLRFVIDASPDASADVAARLAERDARIARTVLTVNVGQHRALECGLVAEPDAGAWVCLDADLQDPPEAVPTLLDRLTSADVDAVFAGRRGTYESRSRQWTGVLHRRVVARLTGLPPDAGAFVALGPRARAAILAARAPSLVVALGAARLPVTSLPVPRSPRPLGRSGWTTAARAGHAIRCLTWAVRRRG
jgi:polyisoprenyl-phosphate glycosyltransferase